MSDELFSDQGPKMLSELHAVVHCRSCGAEMFWAKTTAGKAMPLNAKPEKRILLSDDGVIYTENTYTSHFATCPNASNHRRTS